MNEYYFVARYLKNGVEKHACGNITGKCVSIKLIAQMESLVAVTNEVDVDNVVITFFHKLEE